jgi:hypothetical protein
MQPAEVDPSEDEQTAGSKFIVLQDRNPLPVVPRLQEGFYSCWSTSAEMIMDFLGRHVRQCEQASRPGDDSLWCCTEQEELKYHRLDCDDPNYPDFERWGFTARMQAPQPLGWEQLKYEINNCRPFAFSWMRNDLNAAGSRVSHMLVVVGYSQSGGPETQMLFCLNPRPFAVADEIMVPFTAYVGTSPTAYGTANTSVPGYTHLSDYFEIEPASLPTGTQ